MYVIDNIKETVKVWRLQFKDLKDADEKVVMLLITAATVFILLAFLVGIVWLAVTFIKMVWPFFLVGVVILVVVKLVKEDSE